MKAIVRSEYGSPSTLRIGALPQPLPGDDELLVRIHCTTVNRTDCGILTGKPLAIRLFTGLRKPRSAVPGTDFAGTVASVGARVRDFAAGDRVWGFEDNGLASQAEYMLIRADKAVATIPDGFSFAEAVACAEGAHYAYNMLENAGLPTAGRVLINGATGAIGTAAVQLLHYRGIYVTAVGNTENLQRLKDLGANKVYDYKTEDFTQDRDRYDLILDTVASSSFSKCKHLLKENGVYLSSELGRRYENVYLPILTRLRGGKRVRFPIPTKCRKSVYRVRELMQSGHFQPVIDREYEMSQIQQAYAYVASGMKTGNVIIHYT